jgi:predicted RNA binding protein YcfA (HicA-like mRNA interferase family)
MPSLPIVSGCQAVDVFERTGWTIAREGGGYIILVKPGHIATLSVPDHKEIALGTLRSLTRAAGLTVDDFLDALRP